MTATAVTPSVVADVGAVCQLSMPEVTRDNSLVTELWFKPDAIPGKTFVDALVNAGYAESGPGAFVKRVPTPEKIVAVEIRQVTPLGEAAEWVAVISTPLPLSPEGLNGDYDKLSALHHEVLSTEISRIGVPVGDSVVTEFFTPTVSSADPCAELEREK